MKNSEPQSKLSIIFIDDIKDFPDATEEQKTEYKNVVAQYEQAKEKIDKEFLGKERNKVDDYQAFLVKEGYTELAKHTKISTHNADWTIKRISPCINLAIDESDGTPEAPYVSIILGGVPNVEND